jgi:hypothetical protein
MPKVPVAKPTPTPIAIKPLAQSTPLAKFGLAPAEIKVLTPAAQKVTKAQLIGMMAGQPPPEALKLTVKDLNSITHVYLARAKAGTVKGEGGGTTTTSGGGGCCCCCIACCCCCCAVSVDAEHAALHA